jgi:hypothetical protein
MSSKELNRSVDELVGTRRSRWGEWLVVILTGLAIFGILLASQEAHPTPPEIGPMVRAPRAALSPSAPTLPTVPPAPRSVPYVHPPSWFGDDVAPEDRRIVERAMQGCPRANATYGDPWAMLALLEIEKHAGVPASERGITIATWCWESAYSWRGESIVGDGGLAIGPFQFHDNLWNSCGLDASRGDLLVSARCWLFHVDRVRRKMDQIGVKCAGDSESDKYRRAEAMVANPDKYRWACDAVSDHGRLVKSWQRQR